METETGRTGDGCGNSKKRKITFVMDLEDDEEHKRGGQRVVLESILKRTSEELSKVEEGRETVGGYIEFIDDLRTFSAFHGLEGVAREIGKGKINQETLFEAIHDLPEIVNTNTRPAHD